MNCPSCGTSNAEGAAFCANCGTGLSAASGSVATADGRTRLLMIALNQRVTHCVTFSIGLDGRGYQRVGPKGFCPLRATASGDGSQFAFLLRERPGPLGQFGILPTAGGTHHLRVFQIPHTDLSINLAWNPLSALR